MGLPTSYCKVCMSLYPYFLLLRVIFHFMFSVASKIQVILRAHKTKNIF